MCPCECEYLDKIDYWSDETNQLKQYNELSQKTPFKCGNQELVFFHQQENKRCRRTPFSQRHWIRGGCCLGLGVWTDIPAGPPCDHTSDQRILQKHIEMTQYTSIYCCLDLRSA